VQESEGSGHPILLLAGTESPDYNLNHTRKEGARTRWASYYEEHRAAYWEKRQAGLEHRKVVTNDRAEGCYDYRHTQAPRIRAGP
jgi:hypothetical protein